MNISVIVPVYNAAEFVQQAVESALAQPEVAEVILVEDASPDNSLAVCERLAASNERVHLYRHPDGGNHGAGASRNLAIQRSTCPYVAFLDADDFFLPGRFATARDLFAADSTIDGVYEAVGVHFQDEMARQRWQAVQAFRTIDGLTTMTRQVNPSQLFETLVEGRAGYFCTPGLVVRRRIFDQTGLFDNLRHEDAILWLKMAAVGCLVSGRLDEPVAMRRVHVANRTTEPVTPHEHFRRLILMWDALWQWGLTHLSKSRQDLVLGVYLRNLLTHAQIGSRGLRARWRVVTCLSRLLLRYPTVGRRRIFWLSLLRQLQLHRRVGIPPRGEGRK